jgi:hypothetical protein
MQTGEVRTLIGLRAVWHRGPAEGSLQHATPSDDAPLRESRGGSQYAADFWR